MKPYAKPSLKPVQRSVSRVKSAAKTNIRGKMWNGTNASTNAAPAPTARSALSRDSVFLRNAACHTVDVSFEELRDFLLRDGPCHRFQEKRDRQLELEPRVESHRRSRSFVDD